MNDKYNITGGYLFDKYNKKKSKYDIYSLDDIMDMIDSEFENRFENNYETMMKKLEMQIKNAARVNRRKSKICILLNLDK